MRGCRMSPHLVRAQYRLTVGGEVLVAEVGTVQYRPPLTYLGVSDETLGWGFAFAN